MHKILIIDDDASIQKMLDIFFREEHYDVYLASDGAKAMELFRSNQPPVVITDQILPDTRGIELLEEIKKIVPETQVIIITGHGQVEDAVRAMELGAMNYLEKPIDLQELKLLVQQALQVTALRKERDHYKEKIDVQIRGRIASFILNSPLMKDISDQCRQIAKSNTTVLLQGESGTGKGVLAHYIHQLSDRCEAPFIDVDCTAIPENLIESELFGYEPGAFTDAKKKKDGLIELADKGTLFLDEIGDLPLSLQGKLLKVVEDKSFRKLGGKHEITVDVRIILATNAILKEMVEQGKFRKDLYFRISAFPVRIPPLRERKEDIIKLAEHFLDEISKELHSENKSINKDALTMLSQYEWPGNIRELRNTIEKAIIISKGKTIMPGDLHLDMTPVLPLLGSNGLSYQEARKKFEVEILTGALQHTYGNQSKAAELLGISRDLLIRRMKKYNIDSKTYKK